MSSGGGRGGVRCADFSSSTSMKPPPPKYVVLRLSCRWQQQQSRKRNWVCSRRKAKSAWNRKDEERVQAVKATSFGGLLIR